MAGRPSIQWNPQNPLSTRQRPLPKANDPPPVEPCGPWGAASFGASGPSRNAAPEAGRRQGSNGTGQNPRNPRASAPPQPQLAVVPQGRTHSAYQPHPLPAAGPGMRWGENVYGQFAAAPQPPRYVPGPDPGFGAPAPYPPKAAAMGFTAGRPFQTAAQYAEYRLATEEFPYEAPMGQVSGPGQPMYGAPQAYGVPQAYAAPDPFVGSVHNIPRPPPALPAPIPARRQQPPPAAGGVGNQPSGWAYPNGAGGYAAPLGYSQQPYQGMGGQENRPPVLAPPVSYQTTPPVYRAPYSYQQNQAQHRGLPYPRMGPRLPPRQ